jgi:hypothetical protein
VSPDALFRVRTGAAEDGGGNENGQHGECLSDKARPCGRIWDDVLRGVLRVVKEFRKRLDEPAKSF